MNVEQKGKLPATAEPKVAGSEEKSLPEHPHYRSPLGGFYGNPDFPFRPKKSKHRKEH